MSFDLKKKISWFPCLNSKQEAKSITIERALASMYKSYEEQVVRLRSGESSVKTNELPIFSFHCSFIGDRKKHNADKMSGLIIVDIDNVSDAEKVKSDIMEKYESVLAVMTSPSGDVKLLYLVDENEITVGNYRELGKQVAAKFSEYGDTDTLSITDCMVATYDPNAIVNRNVKPDLSIKSKLKDHSFYNECAPRDFDKEIYEDAEAFFDKVLWEAIASRAENNFHFIQMSAFELAKFGFTTKDHDLEFILDRTLSKSSSNPNRLKEACSLACEMPQIKHPYKYDKNDEDYLSWSLPEGFEHEYSSVENELIKDDEFYAKFLSVMAEGDRAGLDISFSNFNEVYRAYEYGLEIITGIPGHGKTEFKDSQVIDLGRLHGIKTCYAGFEQREEEHVLKCVRKVLGYDARAKGANTSELKNAYEFVNKFIFHVDVSKTGGNIDEILKTFKQMIDVNGCKYFVIDPFNLIYRKGSSNSSHEAVNEILREMVLFQKKYNVFLSVVAHPRKMEQDEKSEVSGAYKVPEFYDLKGSSAFFEMAYHGLVQYRNYDANAGYSAMTRVLKVKQNNLGRTRGECYWNYDEGSGRFIPVTKDGEIIEGDHGEKHWHKTAKYFAID